jgi:peptide deformylase
MGNKLSELLQITELGNPILRMKTNDINKIEDFEKSLIGNMKFTVGKVSGVGLAAPQVNESKSIFIIASKPNTRYPTAPDMQPEAIINPKILSSSEEIVTDWEGCLSIPGLRGLVPRSKSIIAEYLNENGEKVKKQFDDFVARIFQHEFDHLEGIVFLDRMESSNDLVTEREYQQIISKK